MRKCSIRVASHALGVVRQGAGTIGRMKSDGESQSGVLCGGRAGAYDRGGGGLTAGEGGARDDAAGRGVGRAEGVASVGGAGGASAGSGRHGVPQCGTIEGVALGWSGVAAVFALALVVRLIVDWQTRDVATVRHLIGDAAGYVAWARRIARGAIMGDRAFYQAPLYPYLIAVLFKVFGAGVGAIRIAQAVAGAAGCAMLAMAGARLFDRRVGWIAGFMMALYAPGIFYDGIVQKAALASLLTGALVVCVAWCHSKMRASRVAVLGLVVGLLCLTRENALAWLVVLCMWCACRGRGIDVGVRIRRAGLLLAGALVALAPALVHNVYVSGEWSLTTFQAGSNFYIGNSAGADGRYRPLVRGHESPEFERADATRLAEEASGRSLAPHEVSRYWFDRAWSDIAADPVRWVKLLGAKTLMAINAYEVADVESLAVYARSSNVLWGLARVWHFGVLFPLGVVGMLLAWRRRKPVGVYAALAVVMVVGVAAFYVLGRYRLPLVPILVPFAAYGVVGTLEAFRARRVVEFGGLVAAMVALAVVSHLPVHDRARLDAMAAMNAGVAMARVGELEGATKLFEHAVAVHPTSPEANNNLAQALALSGRYEEAVAYYRRALAVDPDLMGASYNLGVALEHLGRRKAALAAYRDALRVDPRDPAAKKAVERLGQ